MILEVLLILLFSLFNCFVIESYKGDYDKQYKKYWHYVQLAIICLIGWMLHGLTLNLAIFYLLYYIFFEPVLNLVRGKPLFYLGEAQSDKWRRETFGKLVGITSLISRVIAIGIIVYLKLK